MRRLTVSPAMGVAVAALAVGLSGGAYAAGKASSPALSACVHQKGGGLYEARRCARHDKRLKWNAQGPRGNTGAAGQQGPQGVQGLQGVAGLPGPSDGYFSQPLDISTGLTLSGANFGAVDVTAGSYIVWATARLTSGAAGTQNAACELTDGTGNTGNVENVNLGTTSDRKVISAVWAETVSGATTFSLSCALSSAGSVVSVDKVSIAAIKVATLH